MRSKAGIVLGMGLLLTLASGGGQGGEPEDKFAIWRNPQTDPVLGRLEISAEQRRAFSDLLEAYAQQRAEIEEKYASVENQLGRRGMLRELMSVEAGLKKALVEVLTAEQRRKRDEAVAIVEACDLQVARIREELDKRAAWARTNPSGYLELKRQCDAAIARLQDERDRELERRVGKLAESSDDESGEVPDLAEGGEWKREGWEYRLRVEEKEGKLWRRVGSLSRDGKSLHLAELGEELDTPWGRMKNFGLRGEVAGDHGWIPLKSSAAEKERSGGR